jgi:hypothetical protein
MAVKVVELQSQSIQVLENRAFPGNPPVMVNG